MAKGIVWSYDTECALPSARYDHAIAVRRGSLYLYGGFAEENNKKHDDLLVFKEGVWRNVDVDETCVGPPGLAGHSLVSCRGRLHLYGGIDSNNNLLNQFWSYDFNDNVWGRRTLLPSADGDSNPGMRAYHTAEVVTSDGCASIWLFGGMGHSSGFPVADPPGTLWELNMATKTWTKHVPAYGPIPRYRHVMTVHQGKLYIYGGINQPHGEVLEDCWACDLKSMEWVVLPPQGSPVRAGAAAVKYKDWWLIHGGKCNSLNYDEEVATVPASDPEAVLFHFPTRQWINLAPSSDRKKTRWGHKLELISDDDEENVFLSVTGGIYAGGIIDGTQGLPLR